MFSLINLNLTILIFFVGVLTGFLSGFLGVGGGFILVPLLILVGVPTHVAIGSSLAYIVFTAISGMIQHFKQKSFDLKLALLISCGGVVTAQVGAIITLYIEAKYLEMLLGVLLLGTVVRMIVQKDSRRVNDYEKKDPPRKIPIAVAIGLVSGFLSGLLGVGGGFLLVPLMVLILHVPIHTAIGTSLMGVTGSAISGAIRHWMIGHVDLSLVGNLAIGGILLAPFGAKMSKKFSQQQMQKIFSIILLLLAFKLLISVF